MATDDNTIRQENPPPSLCALRSCYRLLCSELLVDPTATPEEVADRQGFNALAVCHLLGVNEEQLRRDVDALGHYVKLTRFITCRSAGQPWRERSIERLGDVLEDGWKLDPKKRARLSMQLEVETECAAQLQKLRDRRRHHCERYPHLFAFLLPDGSLSPNVFEGDIGLR